MKIAIVAPSGVPYAVGGAEKFWWGMLDAINQLTTHEVELIKIPTPERSFWEVIESYQRFSELDLDHFDCVISTKYPAWMVAHRNHICYLQHTLRGLYDSYPAAMTTALDGDLPDCLQPLLTLLARPPVRADLPEVFDTLAHLRSLEGVSKIRLEPWCQLPGPLLRKIVHWLDAVGKHPDAIQRYFAISRTVTNRSDYFPRDAFVTVLHHPSDLGDALTVVDGHYQNYLFTASRLDAPKRIDLIINAFKQVHGDVELRIGGDGPELAQLKALASADKRIRFLGRISDTELKRQYASALCVPFVPFDEDYGLITLEAMQAAKAVLTVDDSGGVNELVSHEENGLCVAVDPTALAGAMQKLVDDRSLAERLGRNARQSVAYIQWRPIINALLSTAQPGFNLTNTSRFSLSRSSAPLTTAVSLPYHVNEKVNMITDVDRATDVFTAVPIAAAVRTEETINRKGLPTIVVAVSFPVFPPQGGGQNRIFHLYREVAEQANVTLVTLCDHGQDPIDREIAPGLRERRIPKSARHQSIENDTEVRMGASVGDLVAMRHIEETADYLQALREETEVADVVIASHHYLYPAIRYVYRGPLVYEAHNVEADMKQAVLHSACTVNDQKDSDIEQWLAYNQSVEQDCAQDAVLVVTCSSDDVSRFKELYGLGDEKFTSVPNGVDLDAIIYTPLAQRARYQRRQGLDASPIAFFMGSWHGPNIEAVQSIMSLAKNCPQWQFWIMGSVCDYYELHKAEEIADNTATTNNVTFLGMLSETQKAAILATVDVALNPMSSGSGSNLKMMEYAGAGVPMLSTGFGNRGLRYQNGVDVILKDLGEFAGYLNSEFSRCLCSSRVPTVPNVDGSDLARQIESAYQRTRSEYRWQTIGPQYVARLLALST
jgi:glycosyltransferase involved in cell wall biosynthesis